MKQQKVKNLKQEMKLALANKAREVLGIKSDERVINQPQDSTAAVSLSFEVLGKYQVAFMDAWGSITCTIMDEYGHEFFISDMVHKKLHPLVEAVFNFLTFDEEAANLIMMYEAVAKMHAKQTDHQVLISYDPMECVDTDDEQA